MILRRFMKHVTEQNWFAVGLDVIVVITGIFLGMQVTEWNEGLKTKIEGELYLKQLGEDIDHVMGSVDVAKKIHLEHVDNGVAAIRYFRGSVEFKNNEEAILSAIQYMHRINRPTVKFGNLGELLEGGNRNRILDKEFLRDIRHQLVGINEKMNIYNGIISRIALETRAQRNVVAMPLEAQNLLAIYDLNALKQNTVFTISLQNTTKAHESAGELLNNVTSLLNELTNKIAQEEIRS